MYILKSTFLILTALLCINSSALAKLKIPMGEREILIKVYDLPDTGAFLLQDGHYLDLATLHSEFNIAYILPLWITKDAILVGYDEIEKSYYDIPDEELDIILKQQQLDKASLLSIPFYNKYGGKMVALLIIALLIYGIIPTKKSKVEAQEV